MRLLLLLGLSMLAGCATASTDVYAAPKGDGGVTKDTGAGAEEEDSSSPPTDTGSSVVTDSGSSKDTATSTDTGSSAGGCGTGLTKCGSSCVDTKTDTSNCGACGNTCTSGDLCTIGVCTSPCSGGKTKCGSACVDTATDTSNCGACGTACATGETCTAGSCIKPTVGTTVTFPSTTSALKSGTLGTGGGGKYFQSGDYVTQSYARATAATKLTLSLKMSDWTTNYCSVGTLTWSVLVNGTTVGSYSWVGGTVSSAPAADQTVTKTFTFASIAPSAGNFTLRIQAANTVCSGGGSWNWYPGGTATLE